MANRDAEFEAAVPPLSSKSFWVYVIELDAEGLSPRDQVDLGKGALYVGYTFTTPAARLAKQQHAAHTAGRVFKNMIHPRRSWLRPDLALYAGPWATSDEARRNEKRLHNRLAQDGYKVFGDRGGKVMSKHHTTTSEG